MLINRKIFGLYILYCLFIITITKSAFSQDINQINIANEYYSMGEIEKAILHYREASYVSHQGTSSILRHS